MDVIVFLGFQSGSTFAYFNEDEKVENRRNLFLGTYFPLDGEGAPGAMR